jgi:hypothetical protein
MSIATMFSRGAAAVRAQLRLVLALYVVQLGLGLVFTFAVARTLWSLYAERPLFTRGVAGDATPLVLALLPNRAALGALAWAGIGMLVGYALASLYLGAGLLGALAGRGFGQTAAARFWGFIRLWLWSLIPWSLAALVGFIGMAIVDFSSNDIIAWTTLAGRPLLGLLPALLLAAITSLAVDLARADLVLRGGGSARALARGIVRAVTRPALLVHYFLYLTAWVAISSLFVAATFGRSFPGAAGAWLLLFLRQATALARFLLRAVTSGGQIAAVDGLEVRREMVEAQVIAPPVPPFEQEPRDSE